MAPKPLARRLYDSIVVRVVAYYALLYLALRAIPMELVTSDQGLGSAFTGFPMGEGAGGAGADSPVLGPQLGVIVLVRMLTAIAASLPVAWVFTLTRQKRGYSQSVVQLLVALPPVVAGIVVLVKYSVALAFSLAGIVAAVRFRNSLDDSKDAVYAFLAIGIGICAAVDLYAAFTISAVSSGVALAMWYTDFGKTPAHFEGRMAQQKLERTMKNVSRTGTFVARLDRELFEQMSPEQLEAAAEALKKKQDSGAGKIRLLRIRTSNGDALRPRLETLLTDKVKQHAFVGASLSSDGNRVFEYTVTLRKKEKAETLREEVMKSFPDAEEVEIV
ncbi:MAG TPA: DUF4956 domain-containing protein [Gemmatimonadaceae bacterium]